MTKAQLLSELSSKFKEVGSPELLETALNTKHYIINVFEAYEKEAIKRNIFFYVNKEGTADEAAYYKNDVSTDYIIPEKTFKYIAQNFLDNEIIKGTILKYILGICNEEQKYIEVKCLIIENTDVMWENYIIYQMGEKPIEMKKIIVKV